MTLPELLATTSPPRLDETKLTPTTEVASPFLPGTKIQYAWDSTSLGLIKSCPRLYQYTMIEGYQSRDESIHLRFGIEYHSALEAYDRLLAEGVPRDTAIQNVVKATVGMVWDWKVDESTKAGRYKNRETLIGLVVDYLDHFNPDPATTYIKSDGTPAVELSFRHELGWGPSSQYRPVHERDWDAADADEAHNAKAQPYLLCGHLDRVVQFNSQLFVMDRKTTTTTLGPYYFAQYQPHNQMSLYTLAGRIILDTRIDGVIIDAAQIKLEEPNAFARGFTFRTEAQLEEWLDDLQTLLALAETYATNNYWPMNDTACGNYGGCRFREVCSKDPHVRPNWLRSNFDKLEENARWNPLRAR